MNLKENKITIGELMQHAAAQRIGKREFPQLMNPMALAMVRDMTLEQVLSIFGGGISQQKREHILEELKRA